MKKKLLSLFMACAMILALAVPAFADNYNVNAEADVSDQLTQQVTIATRTFVPTVKLTLPTLTEPSIVLNPYKIVYFSSDGDLKLNGYDVGDTTANGDRVKQVISPVYFIKNETNVKLNFTVAVTGSVEGGVTFSNDPVSLTEKNKKAHVALMVANKEITASSDPSLATTATQDIFASSLNLTKGDVEEQYLKTSEAKFTQPKSLADASGGANYLAFQFKGDLTRQPTPNSWTDEDKIGAVITFTFTPESAQDFTETTALDLGTADIKSGATAPTAVAINTATTYATWKVHPTDATAAFAVFTYDSKGVAKVAYNSTSSKWEITVDVAKVATNVKKSTGADLDATDETITDKVVLSFVDAESMPRTVEIPITYKAKKSAA